MASEVVLTRRAHRAWAGVGLSPYMYVYVTANATRTAPRQDGGLLRILLGTPAAGVIRLSGRPPRRRRSPNGSSTRGGAAAALGARASGARCAVRPPTRGAPEAAGSGYGRGGRKTKKGGRRWRGLGWRAFAGLWFRCASTTGRAGLTTSPCWTRREHLRASAATAPLLLPVGDGGGSSEVAFAESGVSHVR